MTSFTLNGEAVSVEVDPQTPLLWVLRDTLGLTGTHPGLLRWHPSKRSDCASGWVSYT